MPSLNKFCERMRYWCEDANLGYNQNDRWNFNNPGNCDCSSLVIHCLQEAGFDTGSELMRVVQERVGVPNPTGIISRGTICHLQGWLVLSGYDVGGDSAGMLEGGTAKALQRSLNDGRWADGQN